jgi:hypothetical protein
MAATQDSMFAGLFQDPQQYQQAQLQQQMKQNYEIAQMTPEQQVTGGLRTAGYQLGQGLGGMMGVEDPQMKLMGLRKQVLQSIDRNDPKALAGGAQALNQAGDSQGAQALYQVAQARQKDIQEAEVKQSQVVRNLREPRMAALPNIAKLQEYRRQAEAGGASPAELAQIDAVIKAEGLGRQTNVNVSPEIKMANQELDWRKQFLSENKPVIEQAANVQQALGLLQQSQASPFADAAFANTVVSAFGGDKQKSKSEIDRLVKAGSLDERVANTVKGFFEGTTSAKTKEDQLKVLTAVDKVLEQRYNASSKSWSDRLSKVNVNPSMVVPSYNETVGSIPAAGGAKLPPEGTRLRNKKTNKIEIVRNGQLVPE